MYTIIVKSEDSKLFERNIFEVYQKLHPNKANTDGINLPKRNIGDCVVYTLSDDIQSLLKGISFEEIVVVDKIGFINQLL